MIALSHSLEVAQGWVEKPSQREFGAWCLSATEAIGAGGFEAKDLGSVLCACAKAGVQPSPELMTVLNQAFIQHIETGSLPPRGALASLHGYGVLRLTPPSELLDYCFEQVPQIFNSSLTKGGAESKFLLDLAMIEANQPGSVEPHKVNIAFKQLSHVLPESCSEIAKERLHTAARFFGQTEVANQLYAKLESRSHTDSTLQDNVVAALKIAADRRSYSSHTNPKITIREEVVHSALGTPVDALIEVDDRQGNIEKHWLQVDGPTHYFRTSEGKSVLNGKGHLQEAIAAQHPEMGSFQRLGYQGLANKGEIELAAGQVIDRAVVATIGKGMQQSMGAVDTTEIPPPKRPRIGASRLVGASSSDHRPSFQR